jgi:hypothetical protein
MWLQECQRHPGKRSGVSVLRATDLGVRAQIDKTDARNARPLFAVMPGGMESARVALEPR